MLIGYVAIWVFLPIALIVIIRSVVKRGARRTLKLASALAAVEALLLAGGYREIHYWDGWDLNPHVNADDLPGIWKFESESISLSADGQFHTSDGKHGKWSFEPSASVFLNDDQWAVVAHDGKLRLLHCLDPDPDSWNKHRAFVRQDSD